jgi:hypothetical protein
MDEHSPWHPADLVRPYSLTGGRTHPHSDLDVATRITASPYRTPPPDPVCQRILEACRSPQSVAEIAVSLGLPLFVAKVLLNDLIDTGHAIAGRHPMREGPPEQAFLERVLAGLRRL